VTLLLILGISLVGWAINATLARRWPNLRAAKIAVPLIFGATVVLIWQIVVTEYNVSPAILPAPTAIAATFVASLDVLWGDFVQTIIKGGLSGYVLGCSAALLVALLIDRSPFVARGLMPVANFLAALPIVGIAPIMVAWFGFGWESKAAVVVLMVFFPMFVNTMAGLQAADVMQKDLMRTYGASYAQTLLKLRLPAALFSSFLPATFLLPSGLRAQLQWQQQYLRSNKFYSHQNRREKESLLDKYAE
jgi:NitT/TauT family transport system permease protein